LSQRLDRFLVVSGKHDTVFWAELTLGNVGRGRRLSRCQTGSAIIVGTTLGLLFCAVHCSTRTLAHLRAWL
jgi:hypothetical protein